MIVFDRGKARFQYRVAAIILRGDEVLLQTAGDEGFWYLPGGRVEMLESAEDALRRELSEEIGAQARIERLVWVVENFFEHRGIAYHEPGLYFLASFPADSPAYRAEGTFLGYEADGTRLLHRWHSVRALDALLLYPSFLKAGLRSLSAATQYIVHRDGETAL